MHSSTRETVKGTKNKKTKATFFFLNHKRHMNQKDRIQSFFPTLFISPMAMT